MGADTKIQWTDATWNCWQGCHKVSPGCKNCYMYADKKRYGQDPNVVVRSSDATFNAPLKWAKNPAKYGHIKRIFVDSWSDFFIEEADPWRDEAWTIMRVLREFDFQVCTKRPERIADHLPADWGDGYPNVWLGATVEDRKYGFPRIDTLRSIPAAVRFLSCEPLLEGLGGIDLTGIHWVIVGGESGPGARPMDLGWAWSLVQQCRDAGVACFVKQLGAHHPNPGDPKGADMLWWPEHLRVREFPEVRK